MLSRFGLVFFFGAGFCFSLLFLFRQLGPDFLGSWFSIFFPLFGFGLCLDWNWVALDRFFFTYFRLLQNIAMLIFFLPVNYSNGPLNGQYNLIEEPSVVSDR